MPRVLARLPWPDQAPDDSPASLFAGPLAGDANEVAGTRRACPIPGSLDDRAGSGAHQPSGDTEGDALRSSRRGTSARQAHLKQFGTAKPLNAIGPPSAARACPDGELSRYLIRLPTNRTFGACLYLYPSEQPHRRPWCRYRVRRPRLSPRPG
jgi:hypothetical protein